MGKVQKRTDLEVGGKENEEKKRIRHCSVFGSDDVCILRAFAKQNLHDRRYG